MCRNFPPVFIVLISVVVLLIEKASGSAVLNISYISSINHTESREYAKICAAFNPALSQLPSADKPSEWRTFKVVDSLNLCEENHLIGQDLFGTVIAAPKMNCSAYDHALKAKKLGAVGLIIYTSRMFYPGQGKATWEPLGNFSVMVLNQSQLDQILHLPSSLDSWQISFYGVADSYWASICLLILAVVIVAAGSFRSGTHHYDLITEAYKKQKLLADGKLSPTEEDLPPPQQHVSFGPISVVVFALCMTGLITLMYFFYGYLVYLFMILFVLGGSSGIAEFLRFVFSWTAFGSYRITLHNRHARGCCGSELDLRNIFFYAVGLSVSIVWFVYRHEWFSWIIMDIIGALLMVNVLIAIQLPSLKVCTILLSLLFIYDIFFVFITPFFTKDGQSIMVQVATGGFDPTKDSSSGGGAPREVIPALFKIPHIPSGNDCDDSSDTDGYSMLGFGDVMVPGFLISYLRAFEVVSGISMIYSVPSVIGYMVALIVTNVALVLMNVGQPALLYIVPILLIIVYATAWKRGEIGVLWRGNLQNLYCDRVENITVGLSDKDDDQPVVV